MRELKFRAWVKKERRMSDILPEYPVEYLKTIDGEWYVMQYTGLKDKNGEEIYEGDILDWINPMVVDMNDFEFWMVMERNPDKLSIIGNIYETPELLK